MSTTESFEKIALAPVRPVELDHHRRLPPGRYRAQNVSGKVYLLFRQDQPGVFFAIHWTGERRMIRDFRITADGEIEKIPL